MPKIFGEIASCAPSRRGDSYIYTIAPTASNGLAAITSADELLVLDLQSLQNANALQFADVPVGVTSMVIEDQERTSVICAGRDGTTTIFDLRIQKRTSHFKQGGWSIRLVKTLSFTFYAKCASRQTNYGFGMPGK
jgi:hypothetical protein